jgi:hypothetical protein
MRESSSTKATLIGLISILKGLFHWRVGSSSIHSVHRNAQVQGGAGILVAGPGAGTADLFEAALPVVEAIRTDGAGCVHEALAGKATRKGEKGQKTFDAQHGNYRAGQPCGRPALTGHHHRESRPSSNGGRRRQFVGSSGQRTLSDFHPRHPFVELRAQTGPGARLILELPLEYFTNHLPRAPWAVLPSSQIPGN